MKPTSLRVFAGLCVLLLCATHARADLIGWSYDFTLSTSAVNSNGTNGASGKVVIIPGSGSAEGSSTITAANLETFSKATASNPAQFVGKEYSLTMRLTDLSSGLNAYVTFVGVLNGTLSASSAAIKNHFIGQQTFEFDLNHHVYDVTIGNFTPPGIPGSSGFGGISAEVSVHHNPEPSSVILAALGLPALGLLRRRRS